MKYNLFRSRGSLPPWEKEITIYLAPVSVREDHFQVLTPAELQKGREFTILRQNFHFKTYDSCSPGAIEQVKENLSSRFSTRADTFASRMRLFFSVGIITAVLGFINIFVPDPLPFLDEAFMLIGGGLIAGLGWYGLKRQVDPYRNCVNGIIENINQADVTPDPVLSTIYRAIRSKTHPDTASEEPECADDIERESLWLVKHLNLPALIQTEQVDKKDFASVTRILAKSFRARVFLNPVLRKTRRYKRLLNRLGLYEDAAAVYEEFFARAKDLFAEQGEKFP